MKNTISIICGILGIVGVLYGIVTKIKGNVSVSVIGGADGPTSVFLAGKLGNDYSTMAIIIGLGFIIISILLALISPIVKSTWTYE